MSFFTWKDKGLTSDCSSLEAMASRFEETAKLMKKLSQRGFKLKKVKERQLIIHSDSDVFDWYRRQRFYDPRRAMAIRAWMDADLRLALRLLQWAQPDLNQSTDPSLTADASLNDLDDRDWGLQAA